MIVVYLYYLSWIFKVWMLVDMARRRAESYWFSVVIFVPGGEIAYFIAVKLPDFRGVERSLAKQLDLALGRSLKEMRQAAADAPSVANMLALGTALYDRGEHAEAAHWYERVLEAHPDDLAALHGLGVSLLAVGQPELALEPLGRAVRLEPTFLGNASYCGLVIAQWQSGRQDEAVHHLEILVKRDGRTEHRAMLGEYLLAMGRSDEARRVLEAAKAHFEGSPRYFRRMNRKSYGRVKRLLSSLQSSRRSDA